MEQELWTLAFVLVLLRMVGLFPWQKEMIFESTILSGCAVSEQNLFPFAPASASRVWLLWSQAAEPLFLFGYSLAAILPLK